MTHHRNKLKIKMNKSELTLKERELLCSQKGATWNLPFKHEVGDRWRIPRFKNELTEQQIKLLKQNKDEDKHT